MKKYKKLPQQGIYYFMILLINEVLSASYDLNLNKETLEDMISNKDKLLDEKLSKIRKKESIPENIPKEKMFILKHSTTITEVFLTTTTTPFFCLGDVGTNTCAGRRKRKSQPWTMNFKHMISR